MRSHSSDRLVRLHQLPTIAETVEEEEDDDRKRKKSHAEQPALWMCPRCLQARSISEASGPRARAELRDRRKLLTDGRVLGKSGVSFFLSPGSSRCWSAFFFSFHTGGHRLVRCSGASVVRWCLCASGRRCVPGFVVQEA